MFVPAWITDSILIPPPTPQGVSTLLAGEVWSVVHRQGISIGITGTVLEHGFDVPAVDVGGQGVKPLR